MITFKQHLTEAMKLYRGHHKDSDPLKTNDKILWVTPFKDLAQEYADDYGSDGVVSEIKINIPNSGRAIVGELNRAGSVTDILDPAGTPKDDKQRKLYATAKKHFGDGASYLDLPKYFHKVGSEKVLKYFKAMGIKTIQGDEDGRVTYGIIK